MLETSCNPYILSMGSESTATRRLNMAQAFNPIGSLAGMYVAMMFVQSKLVPLSSEERMVLSPEEFETVKDYDLSVLVTPYIAIGLVILALLVIIRLAPMPTKRDESDDASTSLVPTLRRLIHSVRYREGVVTQFFYIGAHVALNGGCNVSGGHRPLGTTDENRRQDAMSAYIVRYRRPTGKGQHRQPL